MTPTKWTYKLSLDLTPPERISTHTLAPTLLIKNKIVKFTGIRFSFVVHLYLLEWQEYGLRQGVVLEVVGVEGAGHDVTVVAQ